MGVGGAGQARAAAAASFPHARRKWRSSARPRVVGCEAVISPVRGAPPGYARGRGGGWAAVALRGLVSAVSTRPHPASPAGGSGGSGRGSPGAGGGLWVLVRVGWLHGRARWGTLSRWGRLPDKPSGGRCGVRKSQFFRSGLSSLLRTMLSEDRWFGCVLFLSLFFFFFNLTHHSLCFSQCTNFVVSCYLFMASM